MNLKVKKFKLNKETVAHLSQEETQGINAGIITTTKGVGSVNTMGPDSDCATRCGKYYCIC